MVGDHFLDNLFSKDLLDGFVVHIRGGLGGDQNVVHTDGDNTAIFFLFVFKDNLGLAVGAEPWDLAGVTLIGQLFAELVGEPVRVGVQ